MTTTTTTSEMQSHGYTAEFNARLPAPDFNDTTRVRTATLVQVVDLLDIQQSLSSQLEKLYAARDKIAEVAPEDETEPEITGKFMRYTVRDSSGTLLYMVFDDPLVGPGPQLGSYLILDRCELHRGILVVTPSTAKLLPVRDRLQMGDQIARLEQLLTAQAQTEAT